MQKSTKEIAKLVQNESLNFGLGSALFGLTKLLFDFDRQTFDDKREEKLAPLYARLKNRKDDKDFEEASVEVSKLKKEKDSISPKFFFITFYDMPDTTKESVYNFSAFLDVPQVIDPHLSQLWDNIYLINLPLSIWDSIAHGDEDSDERRDAKNEQRRLIGHEMWHAYVRHTDPKGESGLDTEENAELFAHELMQLRVYYVNGLPVAGKENPN